MAKKKSSRQRSRQRQNTPLKGHRQVGKTLRPPLNTIPGIQSVPWLRDTLPDMLWLCALIVVYGDDGLLVAAQCIDRVEDVIARATPSGEADRPTIIDGQLTSFDRVPEDLRPEVLAALREDDLYERAFPWVYVRGLSKYVDTPGAWILDSWTAPLPIIAADEPEAFLRRVVNAASHGQSPVATRAKFMALRSLFTHGRIHLPPEVADEWADTFPRYPKEITEDERRVVEPTIRSTFMAFTQIGEPTADGSENPSICWAKRFWRQNWSLYDCQGTEENAERATAPGNRENILEARATWRSELDEIAGRFAEIVRRSDPDLYAPDRFEVLTGLTYRMLRSVDILVQFPALWTMEHGSPTLRSVIETRIVLKWLALKDDPDLFVKFKAYGRGRLKLLKLHLEDYRDSVDDPPEGLDAQIDYLEALVSVDLMEEFQDISLQGNFAGVDTRRMAEAVGMQTEYRLTFAPASASVHGEWAALDQYVLQVCRNPLHAWHRIPQDAAAVRLGPDLVELALRAIDELVADYEGAVRRTDDVIAHGEDQSLHR